jgi:hypothetical protein
MVSRASNIEAVNRQLDIGSQGSELHAVIKARQWTGAASLINGAHPSCFTHPSCVMLLLLLLLHRMCYSLCARHIQRLPDPRVTKLPTPATLCGTCCVAALLRATENSARFKQVRGPAHRRLN